MRCLSTSVFSMSSSSHYTTVQCNKTKKEKENAKRRCFLHWIFVSCRQMTSSEQDTFLSAARTYLFSLTDTSCGDDSFPLRAFGSARTRRPLAPAPRFKATVRMFKSHRAARSCYVMLAAPNATRSWTSFIISLRSLVSLYPNASSSDWLKSPRRRHESTNDVQVSESERSDCSQ